VAPCCTSIGESATQMTLTAKPNPDSVSRRTTNTSPQPQAGAGAAGPPSTIACVTRLGKSVRINATVTTPPPTTSNSKVATPGPTTLKPTDDRRLDGTTSHRTVTTARYWLARMLEQGRTRCTSHGGWLFVRARTSGGIYSFCVYIQRLQHCSFSVVI
jgi:hypothetical protein